MRVGTETDFRWRHKLKRSDKLSPITTPRDNVEGCQIHQPYPGTDVQINAGRAFLKKKIVFETVGICKGNLNRKRKIVYKY